MYDTSVSRETISEITEGIVSDMAAWQNRTARSGLCGAGFDAIVVKALDSQVANRPVYVAIGVDLAGERDVLGMWLGPSGGEGAEQWATMPAELRNRGLADASGRGACQTLPWRAASASALRRACSSRRIGRMTRRARHATRRPRTGPAVSLSTRFSKANATC
ncbi:transposase [Candidatus Poriferisodalis sp.]|uniref:transposase n=1 Tax=Candidatus Poriferisodalis sp. TaxID=3101277 RepID=UPI003B02E8C3